jgi:ribosome-binding ATPase YchF (GTP1/OBG family)
MSLSILKSGIVGLFNVGKSTSFNALTHSRKAYVENYPFCTIGLNINIVELSDTRRAKLSKIIKTNKIIPTKRKFVDLD